MNQIEMRGKNILIYARVSTSGQREKETIKSQLQAIRLVCRDGGAAKVKIHTDDGVSGGALHRPGIEALMGDVRSGEWDMVVIYDVDRLTRRQKHLWTLIEGIEHEGVEVHFLNTPVNKDASGKMQIGVKGLFSEWERDVILERTSRGKWKKVGENKYMGHRAMYGFEYIPKRDYPLLADHERIKIVPEKMEVVKKLFAWALEALSTNEILRHVNKFGVPSPKGNKVWSRTSIHNILKNPIYTGTYYYGRSEMYHRNGVDDDTGLKTGRGKRDQSKWVEVQLPEALHVISKEDFDSVQKQLERNYTHSRRNNKKHEYLLRSLMKCELCGYAVVGFPSKGRTSYTCRNKKSRDGIAKKCILPMISTQRLDPVVWGAILEDVLNPDVLMDQVKQEIEYQRSKFGNHDTELKKNLEIKQALDVEETRLVKAYQGGVITLERLGVQIEEIKKRRIGLNVVAVPELPKEVPLSVLNRTVEEWCEKSREEIEKMDVSEKQIFLQRIIEKIQLGPVKVKIQTRIQVSPVLSPAGTS